MNYLPHEEIQKELKNMLYEIDKFLEKYKITYSIMSGTMLGAVRHNGFIPWDDDIDIAILRPEYNKLIELFQKNVNINEYLYAEGIELGDVQWPFIKIFNKKLKAQEGTEVEQEFLWVDIFPFDALPKEKRMHIIYMKILKKIYPYKRTVLNHNKKGVGKILNNMKIWCEKKYVFYFIKKCSEYDVQDVEWVQDLTWGRKYIPKKLFEEITDYKFENIVVKGFRDYDTYLSCIYGNYMELPPENQRINHAIKVWRIDENEE